MQVAFEKGSHMFWSVGKDKSVKYWDGDKVRSFKVLCYGISIVGRRKSNLLLRELGPSVNLQGRSSMRENVKLRK